jgi:hypothetical protein
LGAQNQCNVQRRHSNDLAQNPLRKTHAEGDQKEEQENEIQYVKRVKKTHGFFSPLPARRLYPAIATSQDHQQDKHKYDNQCD